MLDSVLFLSILVFSFYMICFGKVKEILLKNNTTFIKVVWNTNITIDEQFHYQILDANKRICSSDGIIVKENLTLPSTNETINNYILKCVRILDYGLFDRSPSEIYILHLNYSFDNDETEYKSLSFKNIDNFNYYKNYYSIGSEHKYIYPLYPFKYEL